MSLATARRRERTARRRDRDGSGPTVGDGPIARFPGATGAFALLGEVLMTGMLITLVALPIVTAPTALAAGIRHLRRYVAADDSRLAHFWADVRSGIVPGLGVGVGAVVIAVLLAADIRVATIAELPGAWLVGAFGWVALAVLAGALLLIAGAWSPELGWRGAVRVAPRLVARDPLGAVYLLVTVGVVAVVTWMLTPLLVAIIGCAALAVVAVPVRGRRRGADASR
ncbi:hypothetical protein ET475_03030 [Microbacterium protaetiae]|uniref:DUF624 domain-containing protein n=1 Tax=Microbacterium protaetiae TaxID=2509458 RepID=A0A4P6EG06_9MICO|nr:hypothetical protein [Microbacterium protaetiae]QAY59067.1 hypothetical protein ET475_03030 [Microbacterium protaetiae]